MKILTAIVLVALLCLSVRAEVEVAQSFEDVENFLEENQDETIALLFIDSTLADTSGNGFISGVVSSITHIFSGAEEPDASHHHVSEIEKAISDDTALLQIDVSNENLREIQESYDVTTVPYLIVTKRGIVVLKEVPTHETHDKIIQVLNISSDAIHEENAPTSSEENAEKASASVEVAHESESVSEENAAISNEAPEVEEVVTPAVEEVSSSVSEVTYEEVPLVVEPASEQSVIIEEPKILSQSRPEEFEEVAPEEFDDDLIILNLDDLSTPPKPSQVGPSPISEPGKIYTNDVKQDDISAIPRNFELPPKPIKVGSNSPSQIPPPVIRVEPAPVIKAQPALASEPIPVVKVQPVSIPEPAPVVTVQPELEEAPKIELKVQPRSDEIPKIQIQTDSESKEEIQIKPEPVVVPEITLAPGEKPFAPSVVAPKLKVKLPEPSKTVGVFDKNYTQAPQVPEKSASEQSMRVVMHKPAASVAPQIASQETPKVQVQKRQQVVEKPAEEAPEHHDPDDRTEYVHHHCHNRDGYNDCQALDWRDSDGYISELEDYEIPEQWWKDGYTPINTRNPADELTKSTRQKCEIPHPPKDVVLEPPRKVLQKPQPAVKETPRPQIINPVPRPERKVQLPRPQITPPPSKIHPTVRPEVVCQAPKIPTPTPPQKTPKPPLNAPLPSLNTTQPAVKILSTELLSHTGIAPFSAIPNSKSVLTPPKSVRSSVRPPPVRPIATPIKPSPTLVRPVSMPDSLKISERKYGMTPRMIPEFFQRRPSLLQTPAFRAPKNIPAVLSKESFNKTFTKPSENISVKPTPKPIKKPAPNLPNKTVIPIPKAPSPPAKISTNTTISKPSIAMKPTNATSQQSHSKILNRKNSQPKLDTKAKKKPVQLKHDLSHVKPVQLKDGLNITRVESSMKHSSVNPVRIPQEIVARTSPVAAINTLRQKEAYKPAMFPRYVSPSKVVEPTKYEETVFPRYISPSKVNETSEPQEIVFPRYVSPSQKIEEMSEAQEVVFPRYISPSRVIEVEEAPKEIEKIDESALRGMPEPSFFRRPGFLGPRPPPSFFRSPAKSVEKVQPEPIVIETPTVSFSPIDFEESEPEIIEERVFANAPIFPRYVSKSTEIAEIEEPVKTKEVIFGRNRPNFLVDPSFYRRPIPNGRRPAPFCAQGPAKFVGNIRPDPRMIDESTVSFLPVDFAEEIEQVIIEERVFPPPPVFPRYVPKKTIDPENDDSAQENSNAEVNSGGVAENQNQDLSNAAPKAMIVIEETPESTIKSDYGRRTPFGKAPRYVPVEPVKIVNEAEAIIGTSEPSEIASETPEEVSQQFIKQSFIIPDLLPSEQVEIIEKPLFEEVAPVQFEEIEFEIEEPVYGANRFTAMPQLLRNRAPNSRYLRRTTPMNSKPRPYIRQQLADPSVKKVEQAIETPFEEATDITVMESALRPLPTEVIEEEVISETSIPLIPRKIQFSEIRNPKPILSSFVPNIIETEVTVTKPVEIPYIPRKIDIPQSRIPQPVAKVVTEVVEEPEVILPEPVYTEIDRREEIVPSKQMQIIPRAIQNSLLRAARPLLPRQSVVIEEANEFTPEIIEEGIIAPGTADIPFVPRKIEISRARNPVIETIVDEPEFVIPERINTEEYVEVIPEVQELSVETVIEEINLNPSSYPFNSFARPRASQIPRRPFRAPMEFRNARGPYVRQVVQPEIREPGIESVLVDSPPMMVEAPLISVDNFAPKGSSTSSKIEVVTDNLSH